MGHVSVGLSLSLCLCVCWQRRTNCNWFSVCGCNEHRVPTLHLPSLPTAAVGKCWYMLCGGWDMKRTKRCRTHLGHRWSRRVYSLSRRSPYRLHLQTQTYTNRLIYSNTPALEYNHSLTDEFVICTYVVKATCHLPHAEVTCTSKNSDV